MTLFDKKIVDAAKAAHEVNRIYCLALGDESQPLWGDAPSWQWDSAIHGVEAIIKNPNHPPSASHDNWMAEKIAAGWKYGPTKNPEKKEHPCMVPYEDLPVDQRMKDTIFMAVVKGVLGIE
jgi:hypothetical protein